MLAITKEFKWEAAHRISNHAGECRNLHGHSYKLFVTLSAESLNASDMIIDFKELKTIIETQVLKKFDHALLLKQNEANKNLIKLIDDQPVVWLPFEPTVERMLLVIKDLIEPELPYNITLWALKLYETPSSFGEWKTDKN